ncbi:MAG: N-acetylmuramoyl-L-alanine amidase [Oscillospiraceae bacterium]|nr:N-acetylmuramoyl-L-alanine amidase [Oscillospiraceae bacterium]
MSYKRFLLAIGCLCGVLMLSLATYELAEIAKTTSVFASTMPIVIIDAGHGGFDGGAVADDGTLEKDLNLQISLKTEKIAKALGLNVIMVRTEDIGTDTNNGKTIRSRKVSDLKNRLNLMSKYQNSIYISIHLNKFSQSSVHGAQVFYASKVETSDALASEIQEAIAEYVQTDNNRLIKPSTKDAYILYNATTPAVIIECGFLSNNNDLANLKDDEYQSKIAFSIVCGVLKYLDLN